MSKNKEPLIVDGINVSKCCYVIDYDPPKGQGTWGGAIHKGACRVYSKDCKDNPNCRFKQLARKTQECEKLNDKIIDMNSIIEDAAINLGNKDFTLYNLPFEIKKLRQECEIWKNQVLILDEEDVTVEVTQEQFEEYQKLKQECEELKSQIDADYEYYSQELKTLRSIIENKEKRNTRLFVISNNYRKALDEIEEECNYVPMCDTEFLQRVLDIINKVKGEQNDR